MDRLSNDSLLVLFFVLLKPWFYGCNVASYIGVAPPVTQVRNKNSNIQGRSSDVVKVIFHRIRNCSDLVPNWIFLKSLF